MHQRSGTHRARFNCSKQIAAGQAMVPNGRGRFSQRHNFRMSRGIAVADIAIPSPANDSSTAHHDRSDGNFSRFQRALRRAQSFLHPQFVGAGR
jgi:hypothetical protein